MGAIRGWTAIAKAVGKAVQQSVTPKTARRYAKPGRESRLPVYKYGNGRVYLLPEDLELWARAWLVARPPGGTPAGARANVG